MTKPLAILLVLVAIVALVGAYVALNPEPKCGPESTPCEGSTLPTDLNAVPTNFAKVGNLTFNNPGQAQDVPVLVYEAPGAPALSATLIFDELSACAAAGGSAPCMAMSVQFSTVWTGKRAAVEGNLQEDGKVLVRKLLIAEEGVEPLVSEPGRVFITWPQAVQLVSGCHASALMQTHALDVALELEDGRRFVAVEPVIDEVFRVYGDAAARCGSIPIATE